MKRVRRVAAVTAFSIVLIAMMTPGALAAWNGGHDVMGCTSASKTWYFAEGTTRPGFNEWVCLLNPA